MNRRISSSMCDTPGSPSGTSIPRAVLSWLDCLISASTSSPYGTANFSPPGRIGPAGAGVLGLTRGRGPRLVRPLGGEVRLNEEPVDAEDRSRERYRTDRVLPAGGVAWVEHNRQIGALPQCEDCAEVGRESQRVVEGRDAARAEDDVRVAV